MPYFLVTLVNIEVILTIGRYKGILSYIYKDIDLIPTNRVGSIDSNSARKYSVLRKIIII
jgi:hypothetical protein